MTLTLLRRPPISGWLEQQKDALKLREMCCARPRSGWMPVSPDTCRGVEHRFHSVEEDLQVLVFWAPPYGSRGGADAD